MLGTPFQQDVLFQVSRSAPTYIVGGAVRDAQMGASGKDVDAVVALSLNELEACVRETGYVPHKIGAQHQTVSVFRGEERLDLTGFSGDLRQDALRRDFTVNAIYFDVRNQQLVDPIAGLEDLQNKILRACGEPRERFANDPVRLLRLVRIAVQRDLEIEVDTWQAAQELLPLLENAASERVTEELAKILLLPEVLRGLRLLDELGYWQSYLPELARLKGLVQNRYHSKDAWEHTLQVVANVPSRLLVRLAALFHDSGKWETASHECQVWGKIELRKQEFFIDQFRLTEKNLKKWQDQYVKILGARLDNYPTTIQVKHISRAAVRQNGFEWITEGKRHFLYHERESALLVKKILPRFRWSMMLSNNGDSNEGDLIFLIANHMAGTLTFREELRGPLQQGVLRRKSRHFAWRYGWGGREFLARRVLDLLDLWRADFLGGKVRAEGDLALFDQIQSEVRLAVGFLEQRLASFTWQEFQSFANAKKISGVEFGRFKEHIRDLVVLDERLDLNNAQFLAREYEEFSRNKQLTSKV